MPSLHVRTNKTVRLNAPQQFMARERTIIEEAWPGDVIGIMDRGNLRIGDSLTEGAKLEFSDIPRFPPEHFARVILKDPIKRKQLDAGLRQLNRGGGRAGVLHLAVRRLAADPDRGRRRHPAVRRDAAPPGARVRRALQAGADHGPLPALGHGQDRRHRPPRGEPGRLRIFDTAGNPVILFESEWAQRWTVDRVTALQFHDVAP